MLKGWASVVVPEVVRNVKFGIHTEDRGTAFSSRLHLERERKRVKDGSTASDVSNS